MAVGQTSDAFFATELEPEDAAAELERLDPDPSSSPPGDFWRVAKSRGSKVGVRAIERAANDAARVPRPSPASVARSRSRSRSLAA